MTFQNSPHRLARSFAGIFMVVTGCGSPNGDAVFETGTDSSFARSVVSGSNIPNQEDPASASQLCDIGNSGTGQGNRSRTLVTRVSEATLHCSSHSEPLLRIGAVEGARPYLFGNLAYAARLSDGSVLVADEQTLEFRHFDSNGIFVRNIGRKGQGPNEFEPIAFSRHLLPLNGDTVLLYDDRLRRITRFTPDTFLQVPYPEMPTLTGGRNISGAPAIGRYLYTMSSRSRELTVLGDTARRTQFLLVRDMSTGAEDTLATHTGPLQVRVPITFPLGADSITRPGEFDLPFRHEMLVATRGETIVVSNTGRYEIQFIGIYGAPEVIITRDDFEPAKVDEAVLQRYRATKRAGDPDMPVEILLGRGLPTHSQLLLDDEGNVWVQEYQLPWSDHPVQTWLVLSAEYGIVATVELPRDFRIFHAGSGYVTGAIRDDFGIPYVLVYRLVRK
jgi:hypothetical protein